jgi:hypothetical protein
MYGDQALKLVRELKRYQQQHVLGGEEEQQSDARLWIGPHNTDLVRQCQGCFIKIKVNISLNNKYNV